MPSNRVNEFTMKLQLRLKQFHVFRPTLILIARPYQATFLRRLYAATNIESVIDKYPTGLFRWTVTERQGVNRYESRLGAMLRESIGKQAGRKLVAISLNSNNYRSYAPAAPVLPLPCVPVASVLSRILLSCRWFTFIVNVANRSIPIAATGKRCF